MDKKSLRELKKQKKKEKIMKKKQKIERQNISQEKSVFDKPTVQNQENTKTNTTMSSISNSLKAIQKKQPIDSEYIFNKYPQEHIYQDIINLGLKVQNNKLLSQSDICLQLLLNLQKIVKKSYSDSPNFGRYISEKFMIQKNILEEFFTFDDTIITLFSQIEDILSNISLNVDFVKARNWYSKQIGDFIEQKFYNAEDIISQHASKLIENSNNILIVGHTQIIEKTLLICAENEIDFTAYFILDKEPLEIQEKILNLQQKGINIVWTTLGNLPYFMSKINKVFCGADCIYANGYMVSKSGSAITALFAKKFRKPFYALIRTFKFINKTQINSLQNNQSSYKDDHQIIDLQNDLIPSRLIGLLVTEIGLILPNTVPLIVKEFQTDLLNKKFE